MRKHVAVGLVCVAVVFTSSWIAAQDVVGNPKRGEAVYVQHCASCHGVAGDGKGPVARDLVVPPANFQNIGPRQTSK
jgi:mono/diheme cytochrome c family protein